MSYLPPITALFVALSSIALLLYSRWGNKVRDIPNDRSLHVTPTPRVGGVGLMVGVLAGWAWLAAAQVWWLTLPLLGLFAVSLLDDIYSLPVKRRLTAHLIAAAVLVVGSGLLSREGTLIGVVVLLLVVWMTNLYNFMDGSDGLAGGMALLGFSSYGIAALLSENVDFAGLNFAVAAAALGFLRYNFPPARIFMGDAGSISLGFLAASLGLWGWQLGCWSAWFPLLVFSPFIVDATVTLGRRSLRGAKITEAHREHYYQRAIQMGASHRKVALVEYTLMLGVGASALWALGQTTPWLVLVLWTGLYSGLMLAVDVRWRKRGLT